MERSNPLAINGDETAFCECWKQRLNKEHAVSLSARESTKRRQYVSQVFPTAPSTAAMCSRPTTRQKSEVPSTGHTEDPWAYPASALEHMAAPSWMQYAP
eukprot:CAMPEP_0204381218 /NCGR_PEP_ID=MMETSP0469-20131031/54037_1 /ASSEMBLY_ACC=CAM_ASM_000384 /TAXON_ID=2969 /ORGANISM="Oxyrrhis marina" /LENGTH=99 /DNA_ID=CAMNT_0051373007 /DNA_START=50 /DNA_END=345 /DNA_ORIENTATION=+